VATLAGTGPPPPILEAIVAERSTSNIAVPASIVLPFDRRRTSSPRARPQCERGARPTLSLAHTLSTPAATHRRHADPKGVRHLFEGSRPAATLGHSSGSTIMAYLRGPCRTRPATRGRGHEADGVKTGGQAHGPRVSLRATRNAAPDSQRTGGPRRRSAVVVVEPRRLGGLCRVSGAADATRPQGRLWQGWRGRRGPRRAPPRASRC